MAREEKDCATEGAFAVKVILNPVIEFGKHAYRACRPGEWVYTEGGFRPANAIYENRKCLIYTLKEVIINPEGIKKENGEN